MTDKWTVGGVEMTADVPTGSGVYPVVYDDGEPCTALYVNDPQQPGRVALWGPRYPTPVRVPPPLTCWCGTSIPEAKQRTENRPECRWQVVCWCGRDGPYERTQGLSEIKWREMRGEDG